MAQIRPFQAIHYRRGTDLSKVIAPPFDVLSPEEARSLQSRDPHNIVTVDLPHYPPRSAGPPAVYEAAAATLAAWLKSEVLKRDSRPAFYPYSQTFEHRGRLTHRRGFYALVKLEPFGAGHVVPHEKTYPGPIEDRLALMTATAAQLSPIFGLYEDPRNEVTNLLFHDLGRPMLQGTLDGVRNDLWAMPNAEIENRIIDLMGLKNIYIADGHHRYTTALHYQSRMIERNGGPLPPAHPANWCMFVLVALSDPGLHMLPTHRLVGGLVDYSVSAMLSAVARDFDAAEAPMGPDRMSEFADEYLPQRGEHTLGLYDGQSRKLYMLRPKHPDILAKLAPDRSADWRSLDVSIAHRAMLEELVQPKFSPASPLAFEYTHDPATIAQRVDGRRIQFALILQPTPVKALVDLSKHGEVMPQKSTYFVPKLATGMVINPLQV